LKYFPFTV